MGGNLFKQGRISREKYIALERKIKPYLDKKFGKHYCIPRYYGDKPDFGDMDIIVSKSIIKSNWQDLKAEIINDLKLTVYKSIGAGFSTVYQDFQVDYFLVDAEYLDSNFHYLSFNDIGNLIGKIGRRFNLKYGSEGLLYVYRRADNHYSKDILVSLDFKKIYTFLGLDYTQWQKGFPNKTAMFEWVISSPYFSVLPYHKLSTTMEKRKRERTTILHFLNYLKDHNISKVYDYKENQEDYLSMIAAYFPEANLLDKIEQEQEREVFLKTLKTKYSGKIIMELLPNLKGKALGAFIVNFQGQFEDYEQALYAMNTEEIKERIMAFHELSL